MWQRSPSFFQHCSRMGKKGGVLMAVGTRELGGGRGGEAIVLPGTSKWHFIFSLPFPFSPSDRPEARGGGGGGAHTFCYTVARAMKSNGRMAAAAAAAAAVNGAELTPAEASTPSLDASEIQRPSKRAQPK